MASKERQRPGQDSRTFELALSVAAFALETVEGVARVIAPQLPDLRPDKHILHHNSQRALAEQAVRARL